MHLRDFINTFQNQIEMNLKVFKALLSGSEQ